MPDAKTCPSCGRPVSPKAYDCPHCGHPLRKPRRGVFGTLFKWSLILFNVAMAAWLLLYLGQVAEMSQGLEGSAEKAGAAVGGTIGTGLLLGLWVMGDIILGLATILTKPSK